jgi:hypothetical protein
MLTSNSGLIAEILHTPCNPSLERGTKEVCILFKREKPPNASNSVLYWVTDIESDPI